MYSTTPPTLTYPQYGNIKSAKSLTCTPVDHQPTLTYWMVTTIMKTNTSISTKPHHLRQSSKITEARSWKELVCLINLMFQVYYPVGLYTSNQCGENVRKRSVNATCTLWNRHGILDIEFLQITVILAPIDTYKYLSQL